MSADGGEGDCASFTRIQGAEPFQAFFFYTTKY